MPIKSNAVPEEATPEYLRRGDPALADYYPAWLDNLAEDVTVEGSMFDGAIQGAEAVRNIVVTIRTLYGDTQEFHFAGPWSDNGCVEDYIAQVRNKPLGCVVLATRNDAGADPAHRGELPGRSVRCCSSPAYSARSSADKPYAIGSPQTVAEVGAG
jgi:hypothetical protein